MSRNHPTSQDYDGGMAQLRSRRRGRNSGAQVAFGQPGHVRFTPACSGCSLPLIVSDKGKCPRCGLGGVVTCALADKNCRPPLEWHHAIKQQRLKRQFKYGAWRKRYSEDVWKPLSRSADPAWLDTTTLNLILGDKRNRIWLCSHHHELVTNGRLEVELPQSVWEFADEYGLRAQLENDIARAS